jgi:hypothetical protein
MIFTRFKQNLEFSENRENVFSPRGNLAREADVRGPALTGTLTGRVDCGAGTGVTDEEGPPVSG